MSVEKRGGRQSGEGASRAKAQRRTVWNWEEGLTAAWGLGG